jgi:single-strand DNA-binding protein
MSSLNRVLIIGNLARDPEIRSTADGTKIASLTVATSERWKDKASGEWKEKAEFHRVVIFNERLVEVAERKLAKGKKVFLEGALQTRKWQDKDGADRYSTEIVLQKFRGELLLLDRAERGDADDSYRQTVTAEGQHDLRPYGRQRGGSAPFDDSDSIPFAPVRELP